MKTRISSLFVAIFILTATMAIGQQQYNLAKEHQGDRIEVVNRTMSSLTKYANAVEMNAMQGDGLGIVKEVEFETGTIELDILGENIRGRSFLGIAFNIEDGEHFEAVYFRPFNFLAEAQLNRDHMVQYINHPDFTWSSLRETRTGEFENEIPDPPDPDGWFRAKVQISEKSVTVYVNDKPDPVLEVSRLTSTTSKKIGLWTGFNSSGRFRNLVVQPD